MTGAERLLLLHWLSPAFPVGSFAWSHGLEGAVAAGEVTDAASLADWLGDLLAHGAGRTDAILLAAAFRAAPEDLDALADLAAALAPTAARRAETLGQGAAFAATLRAVHGFDLPDMAYPLAVGRAAALAGLPLQPVAELWLQSVATALVQAAQRLLPLGQTAAARIVAGLGPLCLAVAAEALAADPDDIGSAAFAIDIASARQEGLEVRLFRS